MATSLLLHVPTRSFAQQQQQDDEAKRRCLRLSSGGIRHTQAPLETRLLPQLPATPQQPLQKGAG
jgi:hypothetical protein